MDKSLEQMRMINILREAILQGWELDIEKSFEDLVSYAENYILNEENIDYVEEVELHKAGTGHWFSFVDANGLEFEVSGEIINSTSKTELLGDVEVYPHTLWINSDGKLVQFYTIKK